jgi:uncharacterized protein (TIGR00369 family)
MNTVSMDQFKKLFQNMSHFDRENEMDFEIHSPGHITYRMKILEKHQSSPNTAHGGVIAGFMDAVLGMSALSWTISEGSLTSTVEFKINFIRPVRQSEEIVGTGRVVHKGKSLIISSGEIKNAAGELVAMGQGTFNTYPFSKKDFAHAFSTTP